MLLPRNGSIYDWHHGTDQPVSGCCSCRPQGRKPAQQKLFLKMVSGTNGHRTISWDLILYAKWKMDGCI